MPSWSADELKDLEGRWVRGAFAATMPGACPHCRHNGAFSKVLVTTRMADQLGDRYLEQVEGPPADLRWEFPKTWVVSCACADSSHGDQGGCGRSGHISLPQVK